MSATIASIPVTCRTARCALLDEFATEEVIVVERSAGQTDFKQLDAQELAAWLEDYSLSELYDKNVLGGRP